MRLKAEHRILAVHPPAVVYHLHQLLAALLRQSTHAGRTRVNGVLD